MAGKFIVLAKGVEGPAAVLLFDLIGEKKARARNLRASTDAEARAIEILCLADEPKAGGSGKPVVAVILRIAVGGNDVVAVREGLVQLGEEARRHDIVCIENNEGIEGILAKVAIDLLEKIMHGVALADLLLIKALVNGCACGAADLCGLVRAVIGGEEDREQFCWVVLRLKTVDQIFNYVFFVSCTDQHRVFVRFRFLVRGHLFKEGNK